MVQESVTSGRATDVVLRLVGESGEGTVSLGDLTTRMLTSLGLDVYTIQTFPAEIKGGTVMYQIRARSGPILSHGDAVDVLMALNSEGFTLFGDGLRENGILLYDTDALDPEHIPGRTDYPLPISALARAQKDAVRAEIDPEALKRLPLPKNIVGLGALLRLIDAPLEPAEKYLQDLFGRKGEAIVRMNISALRCGAEHIAEQIGDRPTPHVVPVTRRAPAIATNGNHMLALGATRAGVRFFGGYPITPATEIMEFFAKEMPAFGGDVVQGEDEMAALGMCLGASFAGKKAMTATSGPGFSLMVELINLASQTEVPVVIVDVMRGGASTGMPTKTSQGDLNLALHGVHNENPRIVLAAASIQDCYWTGVDAVNFAEKYQCPVIVLSDQSLATRRCTVPAPDLECVTVYDRLLATEADLAGDYKRYQFTENGISPMSLPGMPGGEYTCSGIEHDELGNPSYTPGNAGAMKDKRFRKLDALLEEHGDRAVRRWGTDGPVDVGIIAFGSTEGVIREATERAQAQGIKVAHLHVRMLNPLPVAALKQFAFRCRRILIPELNYTGQLAAHLRAHADIHGTEYHKDVGVPFLTSEIHEQIVKLAGL